MLAFVAAALAASTSSPLLDASVPWWERITVTVDDKGTQQSCKYQSSLSARGAETCDKDLAESVAPPAGTGATTGLYSKLTFERRFSPGEKLDSLRLQAGDKLLGQQVMFLTFDPAGSIESCRVVGISGELRPSYGCREAQSELFHMPASVPAAEPHQAFMTILVYGHQEQIA